MGIIARANLLIQRITSNLDGFGVALKMTAPNGQVANITGLHTKTHLNVDSEGNVISTKQAKISFSEAVLMAANPLYPLRDSNGEVKLDKHLIDAVDSTGGLKHYEAQSWMPDETVGLIIVSLSDYE
jgi:hypothetical protein